MPRLARLKGPECSYHIMVRSISEVPLFREDPDKDRYLKALKKYQYIFNFKVYAYCLMDNHAHFIIYSNGADISKIMHGLNQSYTQYYNRKYVRHGHLFQDRFKSKIISDDSYLISLSGYIHNNPADIEGYAAHIERYPYSSLGVYLGIAKDYLHILDVRFILGLFSKNVIPARRQYMELVQSCNNITELPDVEFLDEPCEYRSQKCLLVRNYSVHDITKYISQKTGLKEISIKIKNCRNTTDARALCVLFMRCFCNLKYSDICRVIGNITQSRASKLCSIGVEALNNNERYREIAPEFIQLYKST